MSPLRVFSHARVLRLVAVGAAMLLLGHGQAWAAEPGLLAARVTPQQEAAGPSITNEWCPVLTDEPVDPEVHTEYQGQTVYLCCRKCLKQFEADPEAFVANLPAARLAAAPQDAHAEGGHDHPDELSPEGEGSHDEGTSAEHDHANHASDEADGLTSVIARVGRLHPMVVHFPIALLLVAALAEIISIRKRSANFAFAARFCLWLGALGAVAAGALGWADALGVEDSYSGFSAELLDYHRWAGTVTALVAIGALVACERAWPRAHRGLLFLGALLVSVTGHLGASLIFGWDYLMS